MRSRSAILFTALSALTAGLFLLDLAVGAVRIPVADVWAALTGGNCPHTTVKIVVNIRLIKARGSLVGGCGAVGQRIADADAVPQPAGRTLRARHQFGCEPRRGARGTCWRRFVDRRCRCCVDRCGSRAAGNRCRRPPHSRTSWSS